MSVGVWVRVLFDISIVCLFIDANFFGRNIEFLVQFLDGQRNVDCLFLLGLDFSVFLMESLILAQDERWRRA